MCLRLSLLNSVSYHFFIDHFSSSHGYCFLDSISENIDKDLCIHLQISLCSLTSMPTMAGGLNNLSLTLLVCEPWTSQSRNLTHKCRNSPFVSPVNLMDTLLFLISSLFLLILYSASMPSWQLRSYDSVALPSAKNLLPIEYFSVINKQIGTDYRTSFATSLWIKFLIIL